MTSALEESDHLHWCEQRISELNSHKSYLNPVWFTGSLLIGTFAGLVGDKWSLGFLAQTEQQVYLHLGKHLEKLPKADSKSRAIVSTMQQEEAQHAQTALQYGAVELPLAVKFGMQLMAKVMTNVVYYV
jgi:ubiquinone biosynthesis monooxygenase Coq7